MASGEAQPTPQPPFEEAGAASAGPGYWPAPGEDPNGGYQPDAFGLDEIDFPLSGERGAASYAPPEDRWDDL
jgi:hypothetical protein